MQPAVLAGQTQLVFAAYLPSVAMKIMPGRNCITACSHTFGALKYMPCGQFELII